MKNNRTPLTLVYIGIILVVAVAIFFVFQGSLKPTVNPTPTITLALTSSLSGSMVNTIVTPAPTNTSNPPIPTAASAGANQGQRMDVPTVYPTVSEYWDCGPDCIARPFSRIEPDGVKVSCYIFTSSVGIASSCDWK